ADPLVKPGQADQLTPLGGFLPKRRAGMAAPAALELDGELIRPGNGVRWRENVHQLFTAASFAFSHTHQTSTGGSRIAAVQEKQKSALCQDIPGAGDQDAGAPCLAPDPVVGAAWGAI